jgi:hypothetical protein
MLMELDCVAVCDDPKQLGFESMRKCPACGKRLHTNGHGKFWCIGKFCMHEQRQDITPLLETDLLYPVPTKRAGKILFGIYDAE